jgi:hypothetical protein
LFFAANWINAARAVREPAFTVKKNVRYCLTEHGEATWGELLAPTALAAIKADILRFSL